MDAVDERSFRAAMGSFATGVCVIGARDDDGAAIGFTASSLASVSLEPPLVLFCVGRDASVARAFRLGRRFGISILRADQQAVSEAFAQDSRAWFAKHPHVMFPDGAVLLDEPAASLVCEIVRVDDGGDHVIVLGGVLRTECDAAVEPLVHFRGRYRTLGAES